MFCVVPLSDRLYELTNGVCKCLWLAANSTAALYEMPVHLVVYSVLIIEYNNTHLTILCLGTE